MKDLKYNINLNTGTFIYIPEDDNAVDGEGVDELRKQFNEDEEDIF